MIATDSAGGSLCSLKAGLNQCFRKLGYHFPRGLPVPGEWPLPPVYSYFYPDDLLPWDETFEFLVVPRLSWILSTYYDCTVISSYVTTGFLCSDRHAAGLATLLVCGRGIVDVVSCELWLSAVAAPLPPGVTPPWEGWDVNPFSGLALSDSLTRLAAGCESIATALDDLAAEDRDISINFGDGVYSVRAASLPEGGG